MSVLALVYTSCAVTEQESYPIVHTPCPWTYDITVSKKGIYLLNAMLLISVSMLQPRP